MLIYITYVLILLTGVTTSVTDLSRRQILNIHLLIITFAGLIVHLFAFVTEHKIPTLQLFSLGAAIVIGTLMYFKNLWRAGDAKLFFVYALLMPATGNEYIIPLPCLSLFASAFIIGLIILGPYLFKTISNNKENISFKIIIKNMFKDFGIAIPNAFCLSWIIFPILIQLKISQYGIISFVIIYFLLDFLLDTIKQTSIDRLPVFIAVLATGLALRLHFNPQFFRWEPLFIYIKTICFYSILFGFLRMLANNIKNPKDRVPFAGLLFAGCLASYTPFLIWIMRLFSGR